MSQASESKLEKLLESIPTKENEDTPPDTLNKFTSLERAEKILKSGELVLGNPLDWEDLNDSMSIEHFARQLREKEPKTFWTVRVTCFVAGRETAHQWKAYAGNEEDACCIEFNGKFLIEKIKNMQKRMENDGQKLLKGRVRYRPLWDENILFRAGEIAGIDDVPFYKRWPFRCEEEYRVLWAGNREKVEVTPITLDVSGAITKINLSPKLKEHKVWDIRKALHDQYKEGGLKGCASKFQVLPSTLNHNRRWIENIERIGLDRK